MVVFSIVEVDFLSPFRGPPKPVFNTLTKIPQEVVPICAPILDLWDWASWDTLIPCTHTKKFLDLRSRNLGRAGNQDGRIPSLRHELQTTLAVHEKSILLSSHIRVRINPQICRLHSANNFLKWKIMDRLKYQTMDHSKYQK